MLIQSNENIFFATFSTSPTTICYSLQYETPIWVASIPVAFVVWKRANTWDMFCCKTFFLNISMVLKSKTPIFVEKIQICLRSPSPTTRSPRRPVGQWVLHALWIPLLAKPHQQPLGGFPCGLGGSQALHSVDVESVHRKCMESIWGTYSGVH